MVIILTVNRYMLYRCGYHSGDTGNDSGRVASISFKQPPNVHRKWTPSARRWRCGYQPRDARVNCERVASISLKQPPNVYRKLTAHNNSVRICACDN